MSPIRRLAETAWDDASFALSLLRHTRPRAARVVAFAAEVLQRPMLTIHVNDGPVRFAYAGNDRQLLATVARTFGVTGGVRVAGRRAWGAMRSLPECDIEAEEVPWWRGRAARAGGDLVLPRWIGLSVDLDEERLDERRRELLSKAEARGLTAEVVDAPAALEGFLHDYYEPTARARHGDDAFLLRPRHLRHAARRAELLFVRHGATRLAGILLVRRDADVVDAWVSGVIDGDYARADGAVRVALYVHAMRRAKQRGATMLGLTSAPPFLGDGLLRYKRSFGARATFLPSYPTVLRLRVWRATPGVVAAFARSPAVHLADGRLVGIALSDGPHGLERTSRFSLPGVDGPYVLAAPERELPDRLVAWAQATSACREWT